jgi:hypothetical protein
VRVSKLFLFCIVAAALSSPASAEVYESKDAQGNTVFSDMPSKGAAEVKVPPTNSADPVAITPKPTPSPETPAKKPRKSSANSQDEERDDDYLYYGGDYDRDEIDDETRRERRREDGEARPITDRPRVEHHRNTSRPASGGGGRR